MPSPTPHPPRSPGSASFDDLVAETRGLQPWRRAFHAANGLLLAGGLVSLELSRAQWSALLTGLVLVLGALDALRLWMPALNRVFFRLFRSLASPREARGVASSTWYVAGSLLVVVLFPTTIAVASILVLALADPAAAWFGRRFGRRPFGSGTVEGAIAFAVVASGVLVFSAPLALALLIGTAAAILECVQWPLDDNLTVPVGVAGMLWLGGFFFA